MVMWSCCRVCIGCVSVRLPVRLSHGSCNSPTTWLPAWTCVIAAGGRLGGSTLVVGVQLKVAQDAMATASPAEAEAEAGLREGAGLELPPAFFRGYLGAALAACCLARRG